MSSEGQPVGEWSRWWPVVTLCALGLLYTPVISRFELGSDECVLWMGWGDLLRASMDWKHLVPFAVLFAFAYRAFESAAGLKATALTLGYSIFLEYAQGFFVEGHCRVWDVVANCFGMAWGWLGLRVARRFSI